MSWVLVFVSASVWGSASTVQFFRLPAAEECEAALEAIKPLQRAFAAVCITSDGEVVGWE